MVAVLEKYCAAPDAQTVILLEILTWTAGGMPLPHLRPARHCVREISEVYQA